MHCYKSISLWIALGITLAATAAGAQPVPTDSLIPSPFQPTLDQKIDRLGSDVTEIKRNVRSLHSDLIESPISNRDWGVEFNPVNLLFAGRTISLAGTVSNFSWDRTAEVAFPVYYSIESGGSNIFMVDAQYRRFLGSAQRGFYLSGFTRYQHARFETWDYYNEGAYSNKNINRLGIGFGLGGRIFSRSRLYWGWNVSLGRFLIGDKINPYEAPDRPSLMTGDLIIDMELLKIGFAL